MWQMPSALWVLFFHVMWSVLGSHGKHLEDVVMVQLPLVQQEKEQGGHPVPLVYKASLDLRFLVGFSLQREMTLEMHLPPVQAVLCSL